MELAGMLPGGGMKRNQWVRVDDAIALSAWRKEFDNRDVYASVCRFTEPNRSSPYECAFFLDIDAEDLEQARVETLKASDLLTEHLAISPGSLDLFFSGAKGFHMIIPSTVFGEPDSPSTLRIWQKLARRLVKEGIPHIDLGVYQASRVLRLPNSINSKTGLYKVPLEYKELRDLGLGHVLDVARSSREEDSMALPEESPRAVGWFQEAVKWRERRLTRRNPASRERRGFRNGWRVPPCIRNLEAATLPDGIRHDAYFALAKFYAWIGMHPAEVAERILAIDGRHPIRDPKYIERVVRCGAGHSGFAGCDHPVLRRLCERARCFLVGMRREIDAKK
ncbi:MAG: hypothetical protein IMZ44_07135 [Planctomycetes bacterium]|nr:hypothetical protein [Planctomycetota bacterium]